MSESSRPLRFMKVKGSVVSVYGWRNLTFINLFSLTIFALFAIFGLWQGGYWLLAVLPFVYGIWVTIRSTIIRITFGRDSLTIEGETFDVENSGHFFGRKFHDGEGIDEKSGRNELWFSQIGCEPYFLTALSRQANLGAIVTQLNDKLEALTDERH